MTQVLIAFQREQTQEQTDSESQIADRFVKADRTKSEKEMSLTEFFFHPVSWLPTLGKNYNNNNNDDSESSLRERNFLAVMRDFAAHLVALTCASKSFGITPQSVHFSITFFISCDSYLLMNFNMNICVDVSLNVVINICCCVNQGVTTPIFRRSFIQIGQIADLSYISVKRW